MKDTKIIASSFEAADCVVSNDELTKFMDTSDNWIIQRTGIKKRHVSSMKNTSDLALKAAKKVLDQANFPAENIDLIIVATMSPDSLTPSTAAIIQGKLGATNALSFDISAACSGFTYALSIARAMLIANNLKNAIIIGAEVLSKLLDWHDRSTAVLFGDGAGAVLVTTTTEMHFLSQDLRTFGNEGDKIVAGYLPVQKNYLDNNYKISSFQMDGRAVFRFATHEVPASIKRALEKANLTTDQVDHFLLHQANQRIIELVAKRLKQDPKKFPVNISEYGNTAAASEAILLAECIQNKTIRKGDIIALTGFGGGLTVATIIFKF